MGCDDAELSLLLTDDQEIQELNLRYRDKDAPTDVLSFSLQEGEGGEFSEGVLGDVVVSLDTAQRQAEQSCSSLRDELLRLLIHGTLHLVGYDHENVAVEKARQMEEKEEELYQRYVAEFSG